MVVTGHVYAPFVRGMPSCLSVARPIDACPVVVGVIKIQNLLASLLKPRLKFMFIYVL